MASQPPRGLRREDFQIAIICAIKCEYEAVTYAFDEIWEGAEVQLGNAPEDYNKYTVGRIANRNAVLLLLLGMGKVHAASAAVRLRSSYTGIKLAILAGICGGVPGVGTDTEILLGDVIVSRCIVQYDLGRRYADRFATKDTVEDSLGRPHESVRSLTAIFETNSGRDQLQRRTNEILEDIQGKAFHKGNIYQRPPAMEDRLFEPGYLHRHYDSRSCECTDLGACEAAQQASCDELQCDSSRLLPRPRHRKRKFLDLVCDDRAHELRVVIGRLGSGDTVMKSGRDRDRIAEEQDLIAFEMEGAGIWDQFPCIVAKAACDYADSHKNKKYQNFAAARAASATKAILEAFPSTDSPPQWNHVRSFDFVSSTEAVSDVQRAARHDPELEENRRKLLELFAADHETHKNFNPKRVPGTCEWFLRDQRYREWLEKTTSSIIWVSAGPGCGKSVLARTLIDDGRLSTNSINTTVCYFFFKDGDKHRINSYDAVSCILHQLFARDEKGSLIANADNAYKNYGASLRNNFQQLWEILVACASQPESREIICVLDALDECSREGRQDIFQVLESFYYGEKNRAISSRLKFLITSRPYDDLEMSFERMATAESYIRLDGDDKSEEIRHEIDLVIDHKVNEFGKDFREEHRRAISERLKAMENRTYLWLHLTLSLIDEKRSAYRKPSSVQTLLSRLPSSVFDAYEKILSRSQDEEQARYLINIILAATRPLTLDEVNWALTLQAKDFMNQNEFEDDLWPRQGFKMTVKNLCGLFVSVFNEKVSFIHQTAREFLTTTSGLSNTWKGTFDIPFAHGTMSLSCIRLLSLHNADTMVDDAFHDGEPPFVTYAARNWALHYNSQERVERGKFCEAARELCRTHWRCGPAWALNSDDELLWGNAENCTDLTLASSFGLLEVVEHMLETENMDVNAAGGFFASAIEAAASGGYLRLVQSLIRHGASGESALEAAMARGHLEVAKCLLVERGDPVNPDEVFDAVSFAHDRKHIACLIENARKDIDVTEDVLVAAARNNSGGDDILTFLLDRCADRIDITERLLEAVAGNYCWGHRIVALLLEEYGDRFSVTQGVIMAATAQTKSLLLEKRGHEIEITPDVIMAAVDVAGQDGIGLILDKRGAQFELTTDFVQAIARNSYTGWRTMTFLLDKYGGDIILTTETLITAARWWSDGNNLAVFLKGVDGVKVTEEVVVAAASNECLGPMKFLLRECGADFKITQRVIAAVKRSATRVWMMDLLRENRGDEVPSNDLLKLVGVL